jgi:hydrogenase/urease accessory protein HupE
MRLPDGRIVGLVALGVAATPQLAHGHVVTTGFGPFYDGIVHLFATPEDLLPVLALTLWAGLRGEAVGRAVLLALPLAWAVGIAVGPAVQWPWAGPLTAATTTVALGALAAAASPLPRDGVVAVAVVLGVLHGALNGGVLTQAGLGALGGAGVACAVFVVVSLGAGLVVSLKCPWTRVAVRVAGSWIAATGLLMLGWGLRG